MGAEKYEILGTLGSGATGTVYLADEVELDRRVAYKELAPALATDPIFLERFRGEARIMAGLDHPNCVKVWDFFEEDGHAVIVSEYVPGASLRQVADHSGHLSPEQALGVLKGALSGLAYAHGRGLVHRDIKPENLLADEEGVSKLADFGQALIAGGPGAAGGMPAGTPGYMSPEMVAGGRVDLRSDIYACGAMLFEFLTGRAAFTGDNPLAVMRKHINDPVPDPRTLNGDLPEGVGALVTKALAKDPADRQRTAEQFLDELETAAVAGYGEEWEKRSSIKRLVAATAAALGLLLAGGVGALAATGEVGSATVGGGSGVGGVNKWLIAGGAAAGILLIGGIVGFASGLFGGHANTGGLAVGASPTASASPTEPPSPTPDVSLEPVAEPVAQPEPDTHGQAHCHTYAGSQPGLGRATNHLVAVLLDVHHLRCPIEPPLGQYQRRLRRGGRLHPLHGGIPVQLPRVVRRRRSDQCQLGRLGWRCCCFGQPCEHDCRARGWGYSRPCVQPGAEGGWERRRYRQHEHGHDLDQRRPLSGEQPRPIRQHHVRGQAVSNNLAGYEFIQAVGKGAMGSVYLARQIALNRFVAIKQVLGAWSGDAQAMERFHREARALAKMNHPNVVACYNLEAVGSDLYMIQEYVHGPTLKQIQTNSRLGTGQALRVISETAAALDYASKQGILHRDLKPGNLFITTTGVCKLGDFGLVKVMGGAGNFQTQVGTILGTPSYMSPEQAAGKAEIDQRTDVYSLAVMAYELLVGRLPFPPVPGNVMATVEAHISEPPPKPSQVSPGSPARSRTCSWPAWPRIPRSATRARASSGRNWPTPPRSHGPSGRRTLISPPPRPPSRRPPPRSWPTMPAPPRAGPMLSPLPGRSPPRPRLPPTPPQQFTISPIETTALMAGSEETIVRPMPASADETVALAAASDETMVQGAAAPDETVLQPPPPPAPPQSMHPDQPGGAPPFIPPPAAPSMPSPAMPSPAAFTVPQVSAPVYQPPKVKKKRRPFRLLLPLVLILVLAAGAYYAYNRFLGGPALAVTTVKAEITHGSTGDVGHCPTASFDFTGTITTNGGAGDITYQWIQPDGTPATETPVHVEKGQTIVPASLHFTYKGNGDATGDKTQLKVLKPAPVDSNLVPVQYRCP